MRTLSSRNVRSTARRILSAVGVADMIEHQAGGEHARGLSDPFAGDVGGGAVDGLEDGGLRADVGAGGHARPTDQAGDLVREDVAEEVGGDDHIELPGVEDELHRAGVDDALVHFELARTCFRLRPGLAEHAGERFRTFALCTTVTLRRLFLTA